MNELTNYALAKLPSQFADKTNWQGYVAGAIAVPDAINTQSKNLILFDLENCIGLELDVIGEILGVNRESLSDDDYRVQLKLYSKLNNAKGTANFFIFAFNALIQTNKRFYTTGQAEVIMYANFKALPDSNTLDTLQNCLSDGIGLTIYYTLNDEIFISKMQQYQLFANGQQVTADNNDVDVSFGENGQTKRFTQGLYGNGEQLYANGIPIGIDYFDTIAI